MNEDESCATLYRSRSVTPSLGIRLEGIKGADNQKAERISGDR